MSDKESDNYYRLITLIVKTGTRTFRELFRKHIGDDIASVLQTETQKDKIKELKRKRVITAPQYDQLMAGTPDLDKFDISLLAILIRNICTSGETPPGNAWKKVLSSNTTVGEYIILIRNIRNEVVGHSSDTRVSNDLFKTYWAEAEKSLKQLAAYGDILDEIAEEIKKTESMPLTADSNINLEAMLKKWRVEDLKLQKTMDDVSFIRKQIEGGQHIGNSGSANQQTAPDVETFMVNMKTEMNRSKDILENDYDAVRKTLGINTTQQQQTKAPSPIVNPNALTAEEIVKYSKKLDMTKEVRELVKEAGHILLPEKIQTLLRTMLHKWHDVVAQCENENPRYLLAASFAEISDNRTAVEVLGDGNRLKDVKKMKPRPETTNKIKDIDFDVVCSPQTIHHVHHLGPSFEIQNWTNKALEHQQKQPCIERSNAPNIDDVE